MGISIFSLHSLNNYLIILIIISLLPSTPCKIVFSLYHLPTTIPPPQASPNFAIHKLFEAQSQSMERPIGNSLWSNKKITFVIKVFLFRAPPIPHSIKDSRATENCRSRWKIAWTIECKPAVVVTTLLSPFILRMR